MLLGNFLYFLLYCNFYFTSPNSHCAHHFLSVNSYHIRRANFKGWAQGWISHWCVGCKCDNGRRFLPYAITFGDLLIYSVLMYIQGFYGHCFGLNLWQNYAPFFWIIQMEMKRKKIEKYMWDEEIKRSVWNNKWYKRNYDIKVPWNKFNLDWTFTVISNSVLLHHKMQYLLYNSCKQQFPIFSLFFILNTGSYYI